MTRVLLKQSCRKLQTVFESNLSFKKLQYSLFIRRVRRRQLASLSLNATLPTFNVQRETSDSHFVYSGILQRNLHFGRQDSFLPLDLPTGRNVFICSMYISRDRRAKRTMNFKSSLPPPPFLALDRLLYFHPPQQFNFLSRTRNEGAFLIGYYKISERGKEKNEFRLEIKRIFYADSPLG